MRRPRKTTPPIPTISLAERAAVDAAMRAAVDAALRLDSAAQTAVNSVWRDAWKEGAPDNARMDATAATINRIREILQRALEEIQTLCPPDR
jgi:hypothetical protein